MKPHQVFLTAFLLFFHQSPVLRAGSGASRLCGSKSNRIKELPQQKYEQSSARPKPPPIPKPPTRSETPPPPPKPQMPPQERFFKAIDEGDIDGVEGLIKEVSLEIRDNCDWTPLMHAAIHGQTDIAQKLIAAGAPINQTDHQGKTALDYAIAYNHTNTARALIQSSATHNAATFCQAIQNGNLGSVNLLLEAGASTKNMLHRGVQTGDPAIVSLLIGTGVDINESDTKSCTPLHPAITENHPAVAQILIENGASLEECGPQNKPLALATHYGRLTMVKMLSAALIKQSKEVWAMQGKQALMKAIQCGRANEASYLIGENISLDKAPEYNNWTALFAAVYHCQQQIAALIINSGRAFLDQVNEIEEAGCVIHKTALEHAIGKADGDLSIVKLLVKAGASTDGILHTACASIMNLINLMQSTQEHKSKYLTCDLGVRLLEKPMYKEHKIKSWLREKKEIIGSLLNLGVSVTGRCKETGKTVLHHVAVMLAACKENPNLVTRLIKAGAQPNAQDYSGKTPSDDLQEWWRFEGAYRRSKRNAKLDKKINSTPLCWDEISLYDGWAYQMEYTMLADKIPPSPEHVLEINFLLGDTRMPLPQKEIDRIEAEKKRDATMKRNRQVHLNTTMK